MYNDFDYVALAEYCLRDSPEILAHSKRVADSMSAKGHKIVALFHDVIEDTDTDPYLLGLLLGDHVMLAVRILTRRDQETYSDYIRRIADYGNVAAVAVKLGDLHDHLAREETLKVSLRKRYLKALEVLEPIATGVGLKGFV